MPNDSTHRIINYFMLSIFLIINFYINLEKDFITIMIFVGTYMLGTEIFTPDLDTDSKPGQRLGILSYPIRKLSKHRGLGHNIFIGWLLKAIYILFILIIIYYMVLIFGYNIHMILDYTNIKNIYAFMTGLFLSNAMHIIADELRC